jgi:hypothetical protein
MAVAGCCCCCCENEGAGEDVVIVVGVVEGGIGFDATGGVAAVSKMAVEVVSGGGTLEDDVGGAGVSWWLMESGVVGVADPG